MADQAIESGNKTEKKSMPLRGAIFLGIGSMVGAGIFALFGEAGTIAGAAVWVSFLIGGILALALLFDVTAIASIGSAVALAIFAFVTIGHIRMRKETGASLLVLILALIATSAAILLFAWYTLLTSPQTFTILVLTIILAWVVEAIWRAISKRDVKAIPS